MGSAKVAGATGGRCSGSSGASLAMAWARSTISRRAVSLVWFVEIDADRLP
jgi:hypothetical protein